MKRCPYCAEEIQEEAVICRYCFKRVKRSPYRIIITVAIIAALAVFCATHQRKVSHAVYSVKIFFKEAHDSCIGLYKAIRAFPESIQAIKEYNKRVDSIDKLMNSNQEPSQEEVR